jgi:two-component system, OmpR family, response regulator
MNILVVEDEVRVAEFVARGLKAEGYRVTVAPDGAQGKALADAQTWDAILLDVLLPDMNGRDLANALRAQGNRTPILMLTALDSIDDTVDGLRAGADDYLTKPFAFAELVARLEALVRRANRFEGSGARQLVAGVLRFDRDRLEMMAGTQVLELTGKELAILELLMARPGHVLSRERLLNTVWGYAADPLTNVVDVYIGRLRKKLAETGASIETVRGHGYRLVGDNGHGGPGSALAAARSVAGASARTETLADTIEPPLPDPILPTACPEAELDEKKATIARPGAGGASPT